MVDITHRIGIRAPAAEVYRALATIDGVAGWWSEDTSANGAHDDAFSVRFRRDGEEIGRMEIVPTRRVPDQEVVWRVDEGPEEWIGTDVTFHLSEQDGYTIVLFGHRKWREAVEFTAHCSMKWATFLLSLRDLVETGRGRPSPGDLKIDNWN